MRVRKKEEKKKEDDARPWTREEMQRHVQKCINEKRRLSGLAAMARRKPESPEEAAMARAKLESKMIDDIELLRCRWKKEHEEEDDLKKLIEEKIKKEEKIEDYSSTLLAMLAPPDEKKEAKKGKDSD